MASRSDTGAGTDRTSGGGRPKPQSIADWTVAELRALITEGEYAPGDRLSEDEVGKRLDVSRNTLREAFRLLAHERLLVQEHNRGTFVRRLTEDDVIDLFRARKAIELSAVRDLTSPPDGLDRVAAAVAEADEAQAEGNWRKLGTANLHFHQALAALTGSSRMDELMERLLAELRLAFQIMSDPLAFHEHYSERNRQILRLLEAGDGGEAAEAIAAYLDEAEKEILDAFEGRTAAEQ